MCHALFLLTDAKFAKKMNKCALNLNYRKMKSCMIDRETEKEINVKNMTLLLDI